MGATPAPTTSGARCWPAARTMQHALTPGYNIGIADNVISTLAPAVGENLLINSDWRPSVRVNQRGQTIYNGAVYGPDCWKGTNDAVRMQLTTLGLYLTGTDATTTRESGHAAWANSDLFRHQYAGNVVCQNVHIAGDAARQRCILLQ